MKWTDGYNDKRTNEQIHMMKLRDITQIDRLKDVQTNKWTDYANRKTDMSKMDRRMDGQTDK